MSLLIHAQGLSKRFPDVHRHSDRWKALWQILSKGRLQQGYEALQDIDLQVRKGESVGLIGENGAGKSTLLKLIAGVLHPSTGVLQTQGRFSALIELGAGFDPEFSGLENLRMAARLAGLSSAEIREKEEAIKAFADIGEHIHNPVKTYSSGMVVRLGFAVMTAVEPDLIITDEVLAVGDESFQQKSIRWMENYLKKGGTLLLVSHSMYHIEKLCQKAVWLHEGRIKLEGDVSRVTQAYLAWHRKKQRPETTLPLAEGEDEVWRLRSVLLNGKAEDVVDVNQGEGLEVKLRLYSPDGRAPNINIGIVTGDGQPVYGITTDMDGFQPTAVSTHEFRCTLQFPSLPLLPGLYTLRAHAMDPEGIRLFDTVEREVQIHGKTRELGCVRLEHQWHD